MSEKTEIAVSVMPKLETKIVELSTRLEQIMAERAPEAWDAALGVVQINAVSSIFGLILTMAALYGSVVLLRAGIKTNTDNDWEPTPKGVTGLVGGIIGTVIFGLGAMFESGKFVWSIAALTNPELAIAKRILDGVL